MHDLDFHGISALLAACYPWAGSRELGRTRGWQSPFCWVGRSVQDIDELLGPVLSVIKMPVKSCKSLTISHVRIWGGLQDDKMTHKRGKWPRVPSCTLAGGFKAEHAGEWWHLVLAAVVTEPLVERACQLPGVPALVAFWGDGSLMLTFKKAYVGSSAHWQRHFAC